MAQDNWWANDPVVSTTPRPSAPPPVTNNAPPPFIGGTVSPTKQAAEARAQSAEQRAQRSEQRAAEDQEMQRRRLTLEEDKAARDKGGASASESERKAAAFLIRALGSNESYEKQKVGPRSAVGQKLAETAPDFLNTLPAGIGNSPRRQVADANQDEFIAASLRQDSGAAIPEQEIERQRRIYFPMPGDSEETIKAKREARIRAIEGLKQSAGRLEPSAQQRYDAMSGGTTQNDPTVVGKVNIPTIKGGLPEGTQIQFGMDKQEGPFDRADYIQRRYGVTPDQEDWIVAFWNGNRNNPNLTPDGVKQAFTEAGIPPPDDAGVQEGISNAQKGFEFSAFDTSQAEQEYRDRLNKLNTEAGGLTSAAAEDRTSAAGYANRAYTGATMGLGDEIRGLDAAGNAVWAGQNPLIAYAVNRDAERQLQEQSRNEQGVGGWVAEIGGSIPTAMMAPGAMSRNVGQAARAGATVGTVQGFGTGEGLGGSTINALVGGGLGAATGGAVQGGLNKLAARAPRPNALAADARQIVDAGAEWNVPVKTSDVRPPQTPVGRTARLTGEMIPIAGTGGGMGGRATQQASREEAVQRFVKEFGGDPASIDDVTKDLVATRGKELSTLTRAKDSVIDGIEQTVSPVQLRNTLRTIDTQVAKLNRANSEAFAPVISKLESFRNTLASGKSLREVEMNRRLLGDLFADPSLASIKGDGQKALNAVYAPLREDMGAFIKGAAGPEAAAKWKGANDRLSAMAGELDSAKFKGILNSAETTPERAAELLFSKRPSDIRRLFENLSEQGKTKARAAIIHEAAKKSTDGDVISPDKFKQAMMAMDNATGVVFSKNDKTRIDGFIRLLEATQRAKIANTEVMTGARNTSFIAGLGLHQLFGNMTIPASVAIGLMARGYESATFRNLIMNLGKSKKGSPAEAAVGRKVYDYITRAGITQGTPANDIVAERVGASFGQSTTAAAAGEQEQN